MALQSPYVRKTEKIKVSAQIAFVAQKQSNIISLGNSDMVQFSTDLQLYLEGNFDENSR